jgi:hypothetical protein
VLTAAATSGVPKQEHEMVIPQNFFDELRRDVNTLCGGTPS